MLNPNALGKKSVWNEIFSYCRWGEKPNCPWTWIGSPSQLVMSVKIPTALLWKEMVSKSKLTFYKQIPNFLCIYQQLSLHSLCQWRGSHEQLARTLPAAGSAISAPFFPWRTVYVCLPRSPPLLVEVLVPAGSRRGWGCRRQLETGEACTQQQARGRRESGKLSGRWGTKAGDGWLSTLLYLAVYNSRLFLLWWSFLT